MNKVFLVIGLLLVANFANAQLIKKSDGQNNSSPTDSKGYTAAKDWVMKITPDKMRPLETITQFPVVVLTLKDVSKTTNSCDYRNATDLQEFQKGGIWVVLPQEIKMFYSNNKTEFDTDKAKRLTQLFGFDEGSSKAKCFVEIQIETPKFISATISYPCINGNCIGQIKIDAEEETIVRPLLNLSLDSTNGFFWDRWKKDHVPTTLFTGLGYTCDWHYEDGCHYGLTEFDIPRVTHGDKYLMIRNSYTIDEYLKSDQPQNQPTK